MTHPILPILHRSTVALLAAGALSGCTLIPTYDRPTSPVPESWTGTSARYARAVIGEAPAQAATPAADLGWQDYFGDARLRALIELALAHNRDLRIAALNVEAARAQYGVQRAELLPGINASATSTRSRTARDTSATGQSTLGSVYTANAGFTSYELDLFGRVRSLSRAALHTYLGTREARDAAHISLIAEVAKAYVAQRTAQQAMDIARKALESRRKSYDLAQLKFKSGIISAIDLRQSETLIETAQADYASQSRTYEQASNALALLIGQPLPADLPEAAPLGEQIRVPLLAADISADILLRRPDIRQSENALLAANANIGAARAAFFPRISLTGSYGSASRELSDLFIGPNLAWSFIPSISLPIFDWGRNKNNLDLAWARKHIAVTQYEKTIQSAFREVADALAAQRTLRDQLAAQQRSNQAETERLRLVRMRYDNGIASALDMLDAERSSYNNDLTLLSVRQQRLNNQIDIYKVMAGGLKPRTDDASAESTIEQRTRAAVDAAKTAAKQAVTTRTHTSSAPAQP